MTGGWVVRFAAAAGAAGLLAGCVAPGAGPSGPVPLQYYPPATAYQYAPYRPAYGGPIPLQAAPPVVPAPPPLPEPLPSPTVTDLPPPSDDNGAIPVQDMPAPVSDTAVSPAVVAPDADSKPATAPEPTIRKVPTVLGGSNVPLEGFRPMHSQSRPAP